MALRFWTGRRVAMAAAAGFGLGCRTTYVMMESLKAGPQIPRFPKTDFAQYTTQSQTREQPRHEESQPEDWTVISFGWGSRTSSYRKEDLSSGSDEVAPGTTLVSEGSQAAAEPAEDSRTGVNTEGASAINADEAWRAEASSEKVSLAGMLTEAIKEVFRETVTPSTTVTEAVVPPVMHQEAVKEAFKETASPSKTVTETVVPPVMPQEAVFSPKTNAESLAPAKMNDEEVPLSKTNAKKVPTPEVQPVKVQLMAIEAEITPLTEKDVEKFRKTVPVAEPESVTKAKPVAEMITGSGTERVEGKLVKPFEREKRENVTVQPSDRKPALSPYRRSV